MLSTFELHRRLLESKITSPNLIQGCTHAQVRDIEALCGCRLPESYIDFMLNFGLSAGRFMRDIVFLYPAVLTLKNIAQDILTDWEKGNLALPYASHVFAMRQGEQFMFFDLSELKPEQDVFFYFEGSGRFERISESFWDIIERELELAEQHIQLAKEDSDIGSW